MSSHLLAALGPGTQLGSLSRFTPDYLAARKALHELLVFPHLDTITLGDVPDSTTNLFALVASGNSRLSDLTNINVDLARKVISYDAALSTLLDSFTVQIFVLTMQPVAKGYANQARADSETNQRFFSSFSEYVDAINKRITDLQGKLDDLDLQIQGQSEALAERNIITTLWDVLKTLYSLSSSPEESDVQVAALLGVTVSSIFGSFKSLFEDRRRLEQILSGLRALRQQISSLKTKFVALSKGLTVVITNSQDLLNVWDDVAARQEAVMGVIDMVPPVISNQIKSAWVKVSADAKEYADALTQTTSAWSMHAVRSTQFNTNRKVPITKHEIRLHKMVSALGSSAVVSSTDTKSRSRKARKLNDDEKIVEAVIGPPSDTQEKLEELADSTGKIIDQFNNLLQTAYLDQILCTSPIDGSDSNLYIVMNYYREKYLKLQLDTLPVARDLAAYAVLQETLLPYVKRDDQANVLAGDIPLSTYLATNTPLVSGYLEAAAALSRRSTEVKNDWDNAINLVRMKINECDDNIDKWQQSINDLTEQQKKMTMYAILAAFGAFLAFTAAVFLPGVGMLAALAIGGALGGIAVQQAIEAHKITESINDLKAAVRNAQDTKAKLEALLTPMQEIAQNLSKVSLIWSDIATALTKLDAFYTVLNGQTGPTILEIVKPQVIAQWGVVNNNVQEYINTVSK
ncbi:hypothetical protein F5887DRAFT_380707 [Amanita rubescens]|nr:hypothetical protein F5887DRAFT_380707 [Amanita rubescens]